MSQKMVLREFPHLRSGFSLGQWAQYGNVTEASLRKILQVCSKKRTASIVYFWASIVHELAFCRPDNFLRLSCANFLDFIG